LDSKVTPLTQAAYLGRKRIIEIFLDNYTYIDLNLATLDNLYTPISAACMAGHFEIVCLLAENGADVNKVDAMEQSPLIYSFSRMNEDENYYENKALALKMADILLTHGADPNQYSHGRTILMNFCR
jgi:ankyrin repeat protein